jgi:hypothetical protein
MEQSTGIMETGTTEHEMSANLRGFFNEFRNKAEKPTAGLWKYQEYETKLGYRRELSLVSSAMLIETPTVDSSEFSILVIDTQERRLYLHMAYLLHYFALYQLDTQETVEAWLRGNALQSVKVLDPKAHFNVETIDQKGTLEKIDRFGNSKEAERTFINKVRFSRLPQKVQQ